MWHVYLVGQIHKWDLFQNSYLLKIFWLVTSNLSIVLLVSNNVFLVFIYEIRIWIILFHIYICACDMQYTFDKYILNISLASILVHSYCMAINTIIEMLLWIWVNQQNGTMELWMCYMHLDIWKCGDVKLRFHILCSRSLWYDWKCSTMFIDYAHNSCYIHIYIFK